MNFVFAIVILGLLLVVLCFIAIGIIYWWSNCVVLFHFILNPVVLFASYLNHQTLKTNYANKRKLILKHICLKSSCMLLELLLPISHYVLPLAVFISKLISNNCTPKSKSKNNTLRYQNWNQTNPQRILGFCGFDTSIPSYNLDFGFSVFI
jgi:hypothetical protein